MKNYSKHQEEKDTRDREKEKGRENNKKREAGKFALLFCLIFEGRKGPVDKALTL